MSDTPSGRLAALYFVRAFTLLSHTVAGLLGPSQRHQRPCESTYYVGLIGATTEHLGGKPMRSGGISAAWAVRECASCSAELHNSKGPPRSLRDVPRLRPPTVRARAMKHDGAWRLLRPGGQGMGAQGQKRNGVGRATGAWGLP